MFFENMALKGKCGVQMGPIYICIY